MEEKNMVFDKLKEIIVEQLGVEEDTVTPEANIQEDLGADSLDIVDLIQTIEDEYDLSIPDEAVEEIKTVNDIVNYIEKNTDAE
jgi:acyl carrier protein